ncbi:MAG: leucyl aminopeptidase [Vicinamibacterales bacterium]
MSDDAVTPTTFTGTVEPPAGVDADLVCIPVFGASDALADLPGLDEATGGAWTRARRTGEFRDGTYDAFVTPLDGGWRARRVVLIGAGPAVEADAERLRRVASVAAYAARGCAAATVAFVVRGVADLAGFAQQAADGFSLPDFDTGTYKGRGPGEARPAPSAVRVVAVSGEAAAVAGAVRRGRIIGEAVNVTRALANEPANVLTPREFAARVDAHARAQGLTVEVLDEARLEALGMRLLLGVAQGSAEPPRLIVIRHDPPGAPAAPVLAFIGKGVTFDTGGISIKPAENMDRMKGDMAGGAAVAGAMGAIAALGAPCRVIGLIPCAENMPGGRATRPGDVIRGASGKTVEVINTDAEGRLLLADALWYARQQGATHLVDIATLTGACVVALGRHVSGLFGQPAEWVDAVRQSAAAAGDRVWPMPIYEETREQLRSEIADLVNSAGRPGGAVTAAAFLREFAGEGPWAHLDIAGTSWSEAKAPYQPKGPTGVAVRLLTALAMSGGRPPRA